MNISIYYLWFLSFSYDFVLLYGVLLVRPSCPIIALKNGNTLRRSRGRMVRFKCNRGFLLAGERHSTCSHGKWDPSPPKCVRPTCRPIGRQPNNDSLLIYPTHSGAVQHFFCKAGYTLKGPSDVYCDGMIWDNNAPNCLASNTKPKLFCDFENVDLCGYTHDLNHDFDWRRENFNTPSGSIGTGPSFDHTKGKQQDGYYMYIETTARNENDTARLISPVYEKMNGDICLEFFYHMYGATIGSLRVYLKKIREKWNLNPSTAVFDKSGNQGDRWYRGYERLGQIDDEFQIIFEGVRGSGYVSDIAIDDVKIITNCKEEDTTITSTIEDNMSTEMIPIIDSCDKRCGQKEASSNDTYRLTCDCDDDCFDNNRCCPDYYDSCVSLTTESDATSTMEYITTNVPTIVSTSRPTTTISTKATFKPTTASVSSKRITETTRPAKLIPKITRPKIIHIQPPPTTPEIIRKIVSTPASAPNIPERPRQEIDSNDIDEVPIPTKSDEGVLLNSDLPDDDGSFSKEYWSDENDNRFDTPYQRNFSVNDKLFSQSASDGPDFNILSIIIGVIGIVVVACIVVFVVVRKYRWPRRRMFFSNGESQSDVRFFSNDEMLNLALDEDCYCDN